MASSPASRRVPLSFGQERLWFLDRLEPGSPAYNMPTALRLRGSLDPRALRRALGEVVRRHEALRTVFAVEDGEPVQVLRPAGPVPLPIVDLGGLAEERREAEATRLKDAEALRPFDLERGPLLRAVLLRLDAGDHAALFTMHHVVSDAWSTDVLTREVSALYGALVRGEEPRLPPLPVQYAAYAAWQREHLAGDALEAQLRWWREQLADAPRVLELPADRPRRPVAGARAERLLLELPPETSRELRRAARREGATTFMALLGAFGLLLSRWSGQDEVVVGSPIAGRTRSELEGLIGFFVNTLALRVELAGDPTWTELLRRVRETTLGAYQHQDLPFERLVEDLAPERSLAHSPLFQAMFALENVERQPSLELGDLRMHPILPGEGVSQFDLDWSLVEGPDGVRGTVRFRADLFERATVERMIAHFRLLLDAALAAPDRPLSEVPLLTAAERTQVLETWNATARPFPRERSLHELFAEQAARTPGAPAVVFEGSALSYAGLDARADALARDLRLRGVGPETRVGICVPRGPAMAVAVLGALKAGGAWVPLDPDYPAERLAYLLEDSGARVLVTTEELRERLPELGGEVVVLGEEGTPLPRPLPRKGGGENGTGPDTLAYVIYTSGSTGRPKGVAVQHRAVVNYAVDMAERLGLGPDDRVLQFASPGFDVVVEELFPTWLAGGAVVFSREELFAPGTLLDVVAREGVTAFELPTAYWHEWVRELAERGGRLPGRLRFVLVGGERVSPERLREWAALRTPLVHVFGLTETACTSTTLRLEAGDDGGRWGNLPVGRPTGNVRLYVLDRGGQPLPPGLPGELFVGGEGVARGYLGRPALTAERFVPDPFAAEGGARMYRTGDRVRWLADGTLEFLGRIDHQVKIRGFRIEPGEVEAALERHPAVHEAVVLVREDAPGDRRLAAYFTADGEAPAAAALRAHLAGELPEYMVPSAFVALDAFPLTPHGKLDRRALPVPEGGSGREYVAPAGATERVLAAAWAEVLRVDRVGVHDDFFELGGHSLLATRLVSRVRESLGVELPLRALFEAPTVGGLAERVDALVREGAAAQAPPLVPLPRDGQPLPLSFAQQRLWFIDRLQPGTAAYNVPAALRLRGRLEVPALRAALDALVRRHESLRTRFPTVDGEPVQQVEPPAPVPLPVVGLDGLPRDRREAAVLRLAEEEALRPFDLARGPLMRATLLRLDAEDHAALFTLHHAVSDGWSVDVLTREVSVLYGASTRGEEPRLPPLPVQYADYAAWQRQWLTGEVLDAQLRWWRDRLAGAPPVLELPTDAPRRPAEAAPAADAPFALPPEATRRLREAARREGATPFMALLAAWQLLLARWSGQDDVSVGTPIAGRGRTELEPLIGFFLNTLVLRVEVDGGRGYRELLARVRETTLGAFAHQDLPFERLVEELQPERSLTHTPLFQVMFTLENVERHAALELGGLRMEPLPTGGGVSQFDLNFVLQEDADRIGGGLRYRSDLFEAATAERMLRHFRLLLDAVLEDPERAVAAIPLLAGGERRQVVEEWNDTARPYPPATLHGLVERQVERTPDAIAVVHEGGSLTYRELDARAEALAGLLRDRGVGPETRVGVCMERGPGLVAALLAVLKAGGAYVPLDPGYPAGRLAHMLADSAVPLLLAEEATAERLPRFGGEVVLVDGTPSPPGPLSPQGGEGENCSGPDTLAYVIYTSGSTGQPKGAMNTHGAIVNRLLWMQDEYGLGPDDAVLQKTPFSFDVSVWELFWPLLAGARLVLARPEGHRDPAYLSELIGRERVTTLHFVPPMLAAFLDAGDPARCGSVRRVVCSGEALPFELQERFFARLPGAELHNLYGPTEAAVDVTYWACAPGRPVPIGAPVANTRVYVLDRRLEPVPPGVPGELHVGGAQVGRGYLGRPEATAEKFVPDPLSGEPGARMYRTGDRARWRSDGQVEFLGRLDQQVKVRGFRIEPGEVEAALESHPAVRAAVVLAREDVPGDRRLVAYFTAEGEAPDTAGLRAHLAARLPEYMVPSAWVALEAFPLTPNGKLDRRALPAPEAGSGREYVAPRTDTERALAEAWAETLRVERVGVHDHFFEMGGHSLSATRLVSRVREALGVEIPLRAVFETPTLAGLAARVEAERGREAHPDRIPRAPRDRPLPLSFAQQRLWLLDRLEPGTAAYNMPYPLRVGGALDPDALEWALSGVVRRHEALRTRFPTVDGEPVQEIGPPRPVRIPRVALDALPEPRRAGELRRLAEEEARRPFDLERGPLLRATLVRLGADDHALLFDVHHVVSDGWSMEVLVREVFELYGARVEGRPAALPELPVQYADFAAWQRERLTGEVLEAQLAWWRERLAGAPPVLELPSDRPRPPVRAGRGAACSLRVEAPVAGAVSALARREGATLFMALLAGFSAVLARWSGQTDVVVGTPIAGRGRRETEGLIGFFLNTLALRTDLGGDPAFAELLGRVKEATLGAYAHQDVPFERVLEELSPERSLDRTPVFQVMLNLLNFDEGPADGPAGLRLEPLAGAAGEAARYDLTLYAQEGPEGIGLTLVYDAELFEAERMAELLGHLRSLLEAAARDPGLRLSELPLASAEERARRSAPARGVRADRPVPDWEPADLERSIGERFARQARLHPDRVAVRTRTRALTYAELEREADRAARAILRARPGAEDRVALLFEHDAAMIVGMLGALKAGKTYVPIDPLYPRERSAYVLEDSGASALLTNAANLEAARELAAGRVPVVELDAAGDAEDGAELPAVRPDAPAYILYTSGSTGRPKGVVQSHRNVLHFIRVYGENLRIGPDDVLTLFSSYTFDAAVMSVYGALLHGAGLRPFDWREEALDAAEWIRREGITLYHSTPTVFRHLVGTLPGGERFPGVRLVVLGGEEAQRRDVEAFRRHFLPGATLVNGLGPTESTVTLQHFVEHGAEPPRGTLPVGRPVAETEVLLVNAAGEQPAVYGTGEIVIRSPYVALGYWRNPEQTEAAFSELGGGLRAYRTGDLGRRLPGGEVEFLGRRDFQLKIRGHRVEPGEVEAVLRAYPGVREAVAAPWEDDAGERRLAAYLVPEEGADTASAAQLAEWVRARLPEYMVPSAWVLLDELPLTPNGKVDRLALPRPEAPAAAEYAPPRGWTEEALAAVWAEVLGRERVGREDDFFALGGHSLLATRLVSAVRAALGVELPLRAVFEHPTVAGMAALLDALSLEVGDEGEPSEEELRALEEMSEEEAMRLLRGE
ncbi:MAG TPA: amino acid adenylation domain-containing protein [Longimicrobiaceae bacterium]|nr:amino acid adenylation domain-containing protein [Longimicrobiaceae bacterium]